MLAVRMDGLCCRVSPDSLSTLPMDLISDLETIID